MELLTTVLAILVAIAVLFEIARRISVPYPTLFVIGGLGLGFVPGLARFELEPELVLSNASSTSKSSGWRADLGRLVGAGPLTVSVTP